MKFDGNSGGYKKKEGLEGVISLLFTGNLAEGVF